MLERLRRLRSTLWPDPGTTSLSWWLVAIHLALVLLVAGRHHLVREPRAARPGR